MERLVAGDTHKSVHAVRLQKILVPTDFSQPSQNAFRYALRFAKQFGGELTLLHVLETGRRVGGMLELPRQNGGHDERLATAESNLRALSARSESQILPRIRTTVREGFAAQEILEAARTLRTDLIDRDPRLHRIQTRAPG